MASQYNNFDFSGEGDVAPQHRLPNGRFPDDATLLVKFRMVPTGYQVESQEAGRQVWKDVEHIQIYVPGGDVLDVPVDDTYRERFPTEYKAFVDGIEAPQIGTPLSQWPMVTAAQVNEFKFFNIQTVEQLAEMSDVNAQKFMGAAQLKERAKQWLAAAKDSEAMTKVNAELAKRDAEIAELRALIEGKTKKEAVKA